MRLSAGGLPLYLAIQEDDNIARLANQDRVTYTSTSVIGFIRSWTDRKCHGYRRIDDYRRFLGDGRQ